MDTPSPHLWCETLAPQPVATCESHPRNFGSSPSIAKKKRYLACERRTKKMRYSKLRGGQVFWNKFEMNDRGVEIHSPNISQSFNAEPVQALVLILAVYLKSKGWCNSARPNWIYTKKHTNSMIHFSGEWSFLFCFCSARHWSKLPCRTPGLRRTCGKVKP